MSYLFGNRRTRHKNVSSRILIFGPQPEGTLGLAGGLAKIEEFQNFSSKGLMLILGGVGWVMVRYGWVSIVKGMHFSK